MAAVSPSIPKDALSFLLTCISTAKVKLTPDFQTIAQQLGMSEGGARNKYHAITKHLKEGSGAVQTPTKKDKIRAEASYNEKVTPLKRKALKEESCDDQEIEEDNYDKVVRMPVSAKKGTARAIKKPRKGMAPTKVKAEPDKEISFEEEDDD